MVGSLDYDASDRGSTPDRGIYFPAPQYVVGPVSTSIVNWVTAGRLVANAGSRGYWSVVRTATPGVVVGPVDRWSLQNTRMV